MAHSYPVPFNEASRLEALRCYRPREGEAAPRLDALCRLAARRFGVATAMINLVETERVLLVGGHGTELREAPREHSFCGHAILGEQVFVVADARKDVRFRDNPYVACEGWIRFYAAAPLVTPPGFRIGTFCLIDARPRGDLRGDLEAGEAADEAVDLVEFAAIAMERLAAGADERHGPGMHAPGVHSPGMMESAAAFAAADDLHAYLAHELRTPLAAMVGLAEVARQAASSGVGGERVAGNLERIVGIGRDLCGLAEQTLRLARLDRHGAVLEEEGVELAAFLAGLADFVREPAEEKEIAVSIAAAPGLTLMADRVKLGQMCRNLLQNAVRYTPPGGRIRIGAAIGEDGSLEITVSDTGPGMSAGEVTRALAPFARIGGAGGDGELSLGLGLPLTRRLAELHGGRLKLASEPGQGTRAVLRFPPWRVSGRPADAAR